jgi:hypothetical protein
VARRVDNIFFNRKKVQMQALTGQVNVVVCKQNTSATITAAVSWSVERTRGHGKADRQHNGYLILEQLRCSPPPIGNWQKGSHGYDLTAASCNTIRDLVGA